MIVHEVISTEKVPFRYRVAGPGSRFLAYLTDFGVLLLLAIVGLFTANVLEVGRGGSGAALFLLWVFALTWCYFPLFEWLWQGQTPGKRLVGVRVIRGDGTGVTLPGAAGRNLLRALDWLPLLLMDRVPILLAAAGPFLLHAISAAVMACDGKFRRPGDLAAGTLVVHVERAAPPVRALYDEPTGAVPVHAAARQRLDRLDRQQKQTLLDICLRRDQLRIVDRAQLFRAASAFLRQRLELAPTAYQSDEKFVLEMAALLGETAGQAKGLT